MNKIAGIIWTLLACFGFACSNVLIRYLSGGAINSLQPAMPSSVLIFYQCLVGCLILSPWLFSGKYALSKVKSIKWHAIRASFAISGVSLWYISLKYLAIMQVLTISGCMGPIVTTLLAVVLLKERVTILRAIVLSVSFLVGAMIMSSRASLEVEEYLVWVCFLPMLSSLCFSLTNITTRYLTKLGESTQIITSFSIIAMLPVSIIFSYTNFVLPTMEQLPWVMLLGSLTIFANYALNKSFAAADIIFLMPFKSAKYLLSGLLGFIVFAEYPKTIEMWLGVLVISLAAILLSKEIKLPNRSKILSSSI